MKTIAVMNYKGGVGKTTFTGCTAQALALTGFRVLLIDNDAQHDLSTMLGVAGRRPTIRDVYHCSIGPAAGKLMEAVCETDVPYLHPIASENALCSADVRDPFLLKKCFTYGMVHRFYDYVLIDNSPGLDALQVCSLHAADSMFVPTELRQFAYNGLVDMASVLSTTYPDDCCVTRVVAHFYRDTKSQNRILRLLHAAFPGRVCQTLVPYDSVFDELVAEGKNLFLNRLYSKGAAYYLKLVHELFGLDESETWEKLMRERRRRAAELARERLRQRRTRGAAGLTHLPSPGGPRPPGQGPGRV
jgi:chromosome partitioning protein